MATYRILSCDGGGLRGLLTALIIGKLRDELHLDRISLFAGTSTGGIIALGLAGGKSIDQIIELYQDRAEEIFVRPRGIGTKLGEASKKAILKAAARLPGMTPEILDSLFMHQDELWYPRYTGENLHKLLSDLFPADPTLESLGGEPRVLVTTFQLLDEQEEAWRPRILHNLTTANNRPPASHVVESAMCTSAAPTYFPPHKHLQLGYCVDGGLFANNPAGLALATALEAGVPRDAIRLLSIGTGATKNSLKIPHVPLLRRGADNYGILGWLYPSKQGDTPSYPLINAMFEAGSAASDLLARQILGPERSLRIQVPLKASIGLDSVEAIPELKAAAEDLFASDSWPGIRRWVQEHFA